MYRKYFNTLINKIRLVKLLNLSIIFSSIFIAFLSIYPFIINLIIFNHLVLLYTTILIFIIFISVFIKTILNKRHLIKEINELNGFAKNYLIVVYELLNKNYYNNTEKEIFLEFDKIKNKIKILSTKELKKNIRLFYFVVIISLIIFYQVPILFSNAFNLTEKELVIFIKNNKINSISFNYGNIAGKYYIKHNNNISTFDVSKIKDKRDIVFFKGPGIRSNSIYAYCLDNNIIDSLRIKISPPKYQKIEEYSIISHSIDITQYSEITPYIFSKYGIIKKQKYFIKTTDTIILHYMGMDDSLYINVKEDIFPICNIADNKIASNEKDYIYIPFIAIDDYGLDYVGAIIKTDYDSFKIKIPNIVDSIFTIKFNTDSIKGNNIEIIAFAKDNNPYKEQISYSMPIKIKFKDQGEIEEIISDTLNELASFSESVKELYNKMENIKNNIYNNKNSINEFKEQVKLFERMNNDLKKEIEKMSEFKMNTEIYKELNKIKNKINEIDEKLLNKIFREMSEMEKKKFNNKQLNDYVKKNSEEIMKKLKQLDKMLENLKKLNNKMNVKNSLEKLIKKEELAMRKNPDNEFTKLQKEITNKLSDMKKMNMKNNDLKMYNEIKNIEQMSKEAEKNREKANKVKKAMECLMKKLDQELDTMGNNINYDINEVLITLYSVPIFIENNANPKDIGKIYKNMYVSISDSALTNNPLAILLLNGIKMTEFSDITNEEIVDYNYKIIAFLLNSKNKSGGSSSISMEQMMNEMQSMSQAEQAISQMLQEMLTSNETDGSMMNEMAKMQKQMAEGLRKMSQNGNEKILGDLGDLADSLDYLAEQLKKGIINENIIKMEKRINHRMLNIQKSVYKQGLSNKRESKPGKFYKNGIDIILPDNLGNENYDLKIKLYEYLKNYKNKKYDKAIRMYYMEILK